MRAREATIPVESLLGERIKGGADTALGADLRGHNEWLLAFAHASSPGGPNPRRIIYFVPEDFALPDIMRMQSGPSNRLGTH